MRHELELSLFRNHLNFCLFGFHSDTGLTNEIIVMCKNAIGEKHNLALIVFALSLPFPFMGIRRCRVFMKFIYHAASEIRALRRQALSNQPSTQKNTSISARNRLASPPTQQLCCNGNSLSDPFCVIPFGAIKFRHLYFAKFATAPRDETAPQSPSQWEWNTLSSAM